jgi:hypothetical protein
LAPGEKAVPLNVAEESFALWLIMLTIDNKEEIEGIVDPGSQIIAMSKGVCHDIGLLYDPSICNQWIVMSTSLSVQRKMSPVGLAQWLSISKFMLFDHLLMISCLVNLLMSLPRVPLKTLPMKTRQ